MESVSGEIPTNFPSAQSPNCLVEAWAAGRMFFCAKDWQADCSSWYVEHYENRRLLVLEVRKTDVESAIQSAR
jgi:hypothetical protein